MNHRDLMSDDRVTVSMMVLLLVAEQTVLQEVKPPGLFSLVLLIFSWVIFGYRPLEIQYPWIPSHPVFSGPCVISHNLILIPDGSVYVDKN